MARWDYNASKDDDEVRYLFKEFNHLSTTMIVFGSFGKILCHYKSLAPSKSMLQKRNHDFTERYPNIKASTYEPMRIKDTAY